MPDLSPSLSGAGHPMSWLLVVAVLAVLTALNALYVAAEFATVSARKSRIQEQASGGNKRAATLLEVLKDPHRLDNYVAACQVGITLSSLLAGAYGQSQLAPLLTPYLGPVGGAAASAALVLLIITVLQVVFGELLPKTIALRYPERLALAVLPAMQLSLSLFKPLIVLLNGAAASVLRRLGLNAQGEHTHAHSPDELQDLFTASAKGGLIDAAERDMVAGVLNIEERVVREIMTPRTRLVTVNAQETLSEALGQLSQTPYTRFPVLGEDIDDVIGILHLRTLYLQAAARPQARVSDVTRQPLLVPDIMPVPALWNKLRAAGRHSAVVIDEYGGVAGMVTLEDAIEEIFGELQDEFDQEEEPYISLPVCADAPPAYSVRGNLLIVDVNDHLELDLPTSEADTLSGLAWAELGRLPTVGDRFEVSGVALQIESMERRAVRRVRLQLRAAQPQTPAGSVKP